MNKFLIAFCFLLSSVFSYGQNTVISTTGVVDSDSTTWIGGTWSITFRPNPGQPNINVYRINGSPLSPSVTKQGGTLNGSGAFSTTIYDSTQITPTGSQWTLQICPDATSQCGTLIFGSAGTSMDITAAINGIISAPRFNALSGSYGYADVEAINLLPVGGTYYNVVNLCQRLYNGTNFACVGSSVSGYPPAGIPTSTGSAWGASYGTTGTGSSVVLNIEPTISMPVIDKMYSSFDTTYPWFYYNLANRFLYFSSDTNTGGMNFQIGQQNTPAIYFNNFGIVFKENNSNAARYIDWSPYTTGFGPTPVPSGTQWHLGSAGALSGSFFQDSSSNTWHFNTAPVGASSASDIFTIAQNGNTYIKGTLTLGSLNGCLYGTAGVISGTGIACGSSGFTNPMTNIGDIIVGGSGGAAQRLGIGTTGQQLIVSSGTLAYAGTPLTSGTDGYYEISPTGVIREYINTGALNNNSPTTVTIPHAITTLISVICSDNGSRVTSGNVMPAGAIANNSTSIIVNYPATSGSAYCELTAQ